MKWNLISSFPPFLVGYLLGSLNISFVTVFRSHLPSPGPGPFFRDEKGEGGGEIHSPIIHPYLPTYLRPSHSSPQINSLHPPRSPRCSRSPADPAPGPLASSLEQIKRNWSAHRDSDRDINRDKVGKQVGKTMKHIVDSRLFALKVVRNLHISTMHTPSLDKPRLIPSSPANQSPRPNPPPSNPPIPLPHQFHVRLLAVKTGGFHRKRSGSMRRRPPFARSFSRCLACCASTASVSTSTCAPLL